MLDGPSVKLFSSYREQLSPCAQPRSLLSPCCVRGPFWGICDALETSHNAFRENTKATIFSVISQVLEFYSDSYYKTETGKVIHMQKPTAESASCSLCKCGQVKCPLDRTESWRTQETFHSKIWRNSFKRQWYHNVKKQTKNLKPKSKWTNEGLKGSASPRDSATVDQAWSGPKASGQLMPAEQTWVEG